ncbi:UDP-N-acetylglucosamine 2-epimerase [Patescibacteria group bacterium]|nr:UDP-N-acetylglucosamine 2-epimerase [Patescibacteria group bacterium]
MDEITYLSSAFYEDMEAQSDPHVHLIMIATKPDIIKQVPLYKELKKRGHLVILGHTGQHYDENLSGGMLKEFGVEPDFNLNVRGSLCEVVSQIIGRLGYVIGELKEPTFAKATAGRRGKIVIPYIHGDTTTAMAAGNAGYCHGFASVHVEAGIRTLTPAYKRSVMSGQWSDFDVEDWRTFLMDRKNWERGSQEPYPEQFNTRCSEAGTGVHLAPVELDKEFMLSEGFAEDRIFVVGNSVVDATLEAVENAKSATIFEKYPILADGDFVRFCIHRRENCISEKRFMAIFDALKSFVEEGKKVLLINMNQTKKAFERFGLQEEVERLNKEHDNFIFSEVWSQYTDVIAAMQKASVCATDSGSMQEEMNVLGVPCVTLRFGSDRSESVMNGGNLIAPPVDSDVIKKIIEYAWDNEEMRKAPKIYGENVSAKCIDAVESVLEKGEVFRSEGERLQIDN